ncbi:hypothetical protein J7E99_21985 [Streptomyces sp. ISL-44]|uniref:hypothetical protein n=1 Tax=Streptomyces sp. ISL-44 TaxID=2819184 RepID=UPI001BEB14B6|nr:hypothetical protein [Streptomyces sp. ISL-44]MBT2543294.1 hypothetical protein [Streptomyces sp. ISL-44]
MGAALAKSGSARPARGRKPGARELAADTLVPTYRRTGKGGPRLPSVGIRYRAEHIPVSMPQALADRHLRAFTDITPKMRRRNASVFLVRRAQGGTLDEAAQFLGISTPGKTIGLTTKLTHYLRGPTTCCTTSSWPWTPSPPTSSTPGRLPTTPRSHALLDPRTPCLAAQGLYGQRWIFEQEVTPDDRRDRLG